jgi:hypothetical protein
MRCPALGVYSIFNRKTNTYIDDLCRQAAQGAIGSNIALDISIVQSRQKGTPMTHTRETLRFPNSVVPSRAFIPAAPRKSKIYNHDIMHCTAGGVDGNYLYSARALGMTDPGDVIQLHPILKNEWPYICKHYDRVGLSHCDEVIWDSRLERLRTNLDLRPSVFFFGDEEHQVCPNQRWFGVVNYINSKNNFMHLAARLGVPAPHTQCFDRADEINADNAADFVYPSYLKAAISVSGVGIYRCKTLDDMLTAVKTFDPSTPVQVQEEVVTDCFLNMQYQITNGKCRRLLTTEQILEGTVHQGNLYPARCEPWEVVEPMAQWMADHGFEDVLAFDVAVVEKQGETRYLAIECNPRFNGASYPTAIALKLGIREWEARNYSTSHSLLASLDLKGIEYDSDTGVGVIIVNWGPLLVGKVMILLAGPEAERRRLDVELIHRLW